MFLLNHTALLLSHTDKESSECIFCNLKHIACHLLTPQIISIHVIDCFQYSDFKSGGSHRKAFFTYRYSLLDYGSSSEICGFNAQWHDWLCSGMNNRYAKWYPPQLPSFFSKAVSSFKTHTASAFVSVSVSVQRKLFVWGSGHLGSGVLD